MTESTRNLLAEAFRLLAKSESRRELGLIADALRRAGGEVRAVASDCSDELIEIAEASGCGGLVALDLAVAVGCGVEALSAGPRKLQPPAPAND